MKIKLADFGLAKNKRDGKLSRVSFAAGTDFYSSPQQLENATLADERDDIYSMGKTFYQMLTARTLGPGEAYENINKFITDLPNGLDNVILKCREVKKEDRYQTVAQLREAINKVLVT
jgi:serine/threonine-protein kinase